MVKVYLPSSAICTLSLVVNLLALSTERVGAIAQESVMLQASNAKADVVNSANVEPEILAEINRVRTNPQGYAHWLESQKQYYDRIWLKMPGEKPIRAHRLEKAIDEAIAVLKEQKPLPALKTSEQTAATASKKLADFAAANRNIQNISYGRITPKGIVMSLVVDEIFPDRRRRKSLLSPNVEDTGVVCQNDPRYAKVCAIAYSDSEADSENTIGEQPENSPAEAETIASQANTPSSSSTETTTDKPDISEDLEDAEVVEDNQEEDLEDTEVVEDNQDAEVVEDNQDAEVVEDNQDAEVVEDNQDAEVVEDNQEEDLEDAEVAENNQEEDLEDTEVATEALPQPPQPQLPPVSQQAQTNTPAAEAENSEAEEESDEADAQNEEERELAEIEREIEEVEQEIEDDDNEENDEQLEEQAESDDEENDEQLEEVFEAEDSEEEFEQIATNSDSSRLLENVERGVLEEGDRIIAEDGSFYDSYPLEGKSGESFTIALESEEFDAFVALIDAKGNIIEQNDDISEENSNSRIRVTIPENGVYNVIVNAYDEGGSGQYVLTVSR